MFLLLLALLGSAWAARLDLNTATAEQIAELPGIGATKAQAIVAWREQHGLFRELDDLDRVPGIGQATIVGLRDRVVVQPSAARPSPEVTTVPTATATAWIDINSASLTELQRLPGVGQGKAEAILQDRETNGRFASCDELARVPGIGPATVVSVADRCVAE